MPIWLQWVMSILFVIGGVFGVLVAIVVIRRGGEDRPSTIGRLTGESVTLALGIIGLVYLIGGGK